MPSVVRVPRAAPVSLAFAAVIALSACGTQPAATVLPSRPSETAERTTSPVSAVEPAPGSDSAVYAPNPAAIVVAIDAGHGGCLDWGVPDPSERGVDLAEKTLTLEIATRLRDMLRSEGVTVVMTREGDEALAGDDHPPLGCHGPEWRDVNGDGHVGFGDELPRGTRARDELQARLDLANLARADVLVSIHINAPSEGGETIEVAFTQTYYTDERPWADANLRLAEAVQRGVVSALDGVASYERGDRGTAAHNLYLVAPPLDAPTDDRPDPLAQPTRGALMPVALAEVGSITLGAEHDLLASDDGQAAVAAGLFEGLVAYFSDRPLAARIALADTGGAGRDGEAPEAVAGSGPPFWPSSVDPAAVALRVTNTGTAPWTAGATIVAGLEATDKPYLADAPSRLAPMGEIPPLAPGESFELRVALPGSAAPKLAWISLMVDQTNIADAGSPPLQVSTGAH
jgi:N-acetylmuramoyl-L-alanine amidase